MNSKLIGNEKDIIFYTDEDGKTNIEVVLQNEDIWLNAQAIAELFNVNDKAIYKHIANIYEQEELEEISTVSILETIGKNGHRYKTKYYNLDMIISIGYRVNSKKAVKFRQWASKIIKEYIIKGFALDDDRFLKGGKVNRQYFDELLERIKVIRTSERMAYQKITDIYATACDYQKNATTTQEFYAKVQNKLHWAITGKTAAEIVYSSADATKKHMGLTSWAQAPDGKVLKSDVTIAKNYLHIEQMKELNGIVSAYIDLAANRAKRHIPTTMEQWVKFLDGFLELSSYPILIDKGKVSALEARLKAYEEYDKFRVIQDREFLSDFDKEVMRLKGELGLFDN